MFSLLTKEAEFEWKDDCNTTFDCIKDKLIIAPVLQGPNWELSFHIHYDASDKSI